MKKRAALLAAAVSVSAVAAAMSMPVASAGQTVTLNWLIRSDTAEVAWAKQVVTGFEKQNPSIKVNLIVIPQAQIDQKIQTMIAGGSPPDVFMPNWANGGYATYKSDLLNLNPYLKEDPGVLKGFAPNLVKSYNSHGQQLGLPILGLGSFLFYNKDLFNKAHIPYPTTNWDDKSWNWDKMVAIAKKLTQNKGNPSKEIYGINDELAEVGDPWLYGADFFKPAAYVTGKMGPVNVTAPGVVKGVEAHLQLIKEGLSPSPNLTTALSALGDPFLSGRVAMEMVGGWGFWNFTPAKFKWGVAALPWGTAHKDVLYTDLVSIEKSTKYPEQSWKLVKYIVNPNGALKGLTVDQGATPPQAKLLSEWYTNESKNLAMPVAKIRQLQQGALKYGQESPNHLIFGYATISSTMDQSLNSIYNGQLSVKEGLSQMKQHLEALKLN